MREEDEPKKRGWFSRKKKISTPAPRTPRPPTAMPLSAHHRQGSSQTTIDDEDLPPREEQLRTPTPGTPALSTPVAESSTKEIAESDLGTPGTPALPKHAGFDFRAIKEVIGKGDIAPEELQIPAPPRFQVPVIPPPTQRSESAPPPTPGPATPRPRPSLDYSEGPMAGPSSPSPDLSSTLARSMSLNDMRGEAEAKDALTSADAQITTKSESSQTPPSVLLGNHNLTAWPAGSGRPSPAFASSNPFTSAFDDRPAYDLLHPSGTGSYGLSRLPDNPFAPTTDSSGLAFGAADGSITFSPLSSTATEPADPWSVPTPSFGAFSAKKPASSFNVNSNPWQS